MESCLPNKRRSLVRNHCSQSAPAFLEQRWYCRCSGLNPLWSRLSFMPFGLPPFLTGSLLHLIGLMLFRSFTEAPFIATGIIQTEFFIHLLALVACVGFLPARQSQPSVRSLCRNVANDASWMLLARLCHEVCVLDNPGHKRFFRYEIFDHYRLPK